MAPRRSRNGIATAATARARSTSSSGDGISSGYATVAWGRKLRCHRRIPRFAKSLDLLAERSAEDDHRVRKAPRAAPARAERQLDEAAHETVVLPLVLVEQVEVARADPAELHVLGHLQPGAGLVSHDVGEEVELTPRRLPRARLPVAHVRQARRAGDLPARLLLDFAPSASRSRSPSSTWPPTRSQQPGRKLRSQPRRWTNTRPARSRISAPTTGL
jgi:hypothetical protein